MTIFVGSLQYIRRCSNSDYNPENQKEQNGLNGLNLTSWDKMLLKENQFTFKMMN